MLVSKAVDLFQVMLDKYASPNLDDDEVLDYINIGINEELDRLFPDNEGGLVNFELDSNVTANLQPLIFNLTEINMNGSGVVSDAVINSALVTASGQSDAEYFRIASVGFGDYPCKYLKMNNIFSFVRNVFKQPSLTNPRFRFISGGLQFYPVSPSTALTINTIKKPVVLTSSNLSDTMEFGDYTSYNIIALALKASGVTLRDNEILADMRASGLQIVQ